MAQNLRCVEDDESHRIRLELLNKAQRAVSEYETQLLRHVERTQSGEVAVDEEHEHDRRAHDDQHDRAGRAHRVRDRLDYWGLRRCGG